MNLTKDIKESFDIINYNHTQFVKLFKKLVMNKFKNITPEDHKKIKTWLKQYDNILNLSHNCLLNLNEKIEEQEEQENLNFEINNQFIVSFVILSNFFNSVV